MHIPQKVRHEQPELFPENVNRGLRTESGEKSGEVECYLSQYRDAGTDNYLSHGFEAGASIPQSSSLSNDAGWGE